MDSKQRISFRQRTSLNTDVRFIGAAFAALFVLPSLLGGLCLRELDALQTGWPWRNAKYAKATITGYRVEHIGGMTWGSEGKVFGGTYEHHLEYEYTVAHANIDFDWNVSSRSESSISIGERNFSPRVGATLPVFFKPDSPEDHLPFIDLRDVFWHSVWRISLWSGVILAGALMVVLIIVFYRPNRRDRSGLPEKISI
jgi:hypothetical protein